MTLTLDSIKQDSLNTQGDTIISETGPKTFIPPVEFPTTKISWTDAPGNITRSSQMIKRPPSWAQNFQLSSNTRYEQEVL